MYLSLKEQFSLVANNTIPTTTTSIITKNEDSTFNEQLRESKVTVNLNDCMACYVRVSRCKVKWERCINFKRKFIFRLKTTIILTIQTHMRHLISRYKNDKKKKKKKKRRHQSYHNNNKISWNKKYHNRKMKNNVIQQDLILKILIWCKMMLISICYGQIRRISRIKQNKFPN